MTNPETEIEVYESSEVEKAPEVFSEDDLRREIIKRVVRGKPASEIARELRIPKENVNKAIQEVRQYSTDLLAGEELRFFLADSLMVFKELERTAWEEYENSVDSRLRARMIEVISSIRKDSIAIREKFEQFSTQKQKEIPFKRIAALSEEIRIKMSQIVMQQVGGFAELQEPVPAKIIETVKE